MWVVVFVVVCILKKNRICYRRILRIEDPAIATAFAVVQIVTWIIVGCRPVIYYRRIIRVEDCRVGDVQ